MYDWNRQRPKPLITDEPWQGYGGSAASTPEAKREAEPSVGRSGGLARVRGEIEAEIERATKARAEGVFQTERFYNLGRMDALRAALRIIDTHAHEG